MNKLITFWSKSKGRKSFWALGAVACLALGALGTTFASNISLNSGGNVEFGQGMLQTTACTGDDEITLTPVATFLHDETHANFYFTSVTVSDIPDSCLGKDFVIKAYNNTSRIPLEIFDTTASSAVVYYYDGSFALGSGINGITLTNDDPGTFTLVFDVPVAVSSTIFSITIESQDHVVI